MKFSIKDFFSNYDQIHSKLPIWSHLLTESLMENFTLGAEMAKRNLKSYDVNKACLALYMKGLTHFVPTLPYIHVFRSSHWRCSTKKLSITILHYLQENTCAGVCFELQAFRSATLLKGYSNTDVFL